MDQWWSDLDEAVLGCFTQGRPLAPAEIGRKLGISEAGVASLLAMLAREGKVRITLVELCDAAKPERLGSGGPRRSDGARNDGGRPEFEPTLTLGE
jgi:hypothetical protein